MQKGDKVQHKVTKRLGEVHSFSKKHPGWVKVQWEGDDTAYRYEPEELSLVHGEVEVIVHDWTARNL